MVDPDLREHLISVEEKAMQDWTLSWDDNEPISSRGVAERRVDRMLAALAEAPLPERYVGASVEQLRLALDGVLYNLSADALNRLERLNLHGRTMPGVTLGLVVQALLCEQLTRALWEASEPEDAVRARPAADDGPWEYGINDGAKVWHPKAYGDDGWVSVGTRDEAEAFIAARDPSWDPWHIVRRRPAEGPGSWEDVPKLAQ